MICEIVAVGTELLLGQIPNTDAQFLSRRLAALGISVYHHTTVGDNPQRLREALELALSRADLVITTGGLGPTQDDLTKQTAAELFGLPMKLDQAALDAAREYSTKSGRVFTEESRSQAYFAEGSVILPNRCGTAPGCLLEKDGKMLVQLPGPPAELQDMFDREVFPRLAERTGGCIASRYIRVYGRGEAEVASMCTQWIDSRGPVTCAPYCGKGECMLRVSARGETEAAALVAIRPVEKEILSVLGDCVYAVGDTADGTMQQAAGEALVAKGLTVSTAESCTGGLVAAKLIEYPGISACLNEAHVTYANEAKEQYCGVKRATLLEFGAVSEETCREMCEGLRAKTGADIAVSTTGIAGPGGGTPEKPVGLVYVGCASAKGTKIRRLQLTGDRQRIRELAALCALDLVRRAAREL